MSLRFRWLTIFAFCIPFSAHAGKAGIASAHPLATKAGMEILAQGGNAFDAAITVTSVLAVVEPYGSGIGGGGFWLLHQASDQSNVMLDGREVAPLAATADMYLDENGEVIKGASINGAKAAGIPGEPAALVWLAENKGKLPLKTTLAAAIKYAKEGFPVDAYYRKMLGFRKDAIAASPAAGEVFLKDGEIPDLGTLIIQTDLAYVLEQLAEKGLAGFYEGDVAKKLVDGVQANGGIWSLEDLKNYTVKLRTPIISSYKDMKLISAAPPSSGGIVMAEILNMLEEFDLSTMTQAQRIHIIAEAMRRAYRDRAEYMGDPDFVDMPVNTLISQEYAVGLTQNIRLDQATPSQTLADTYHHDAKGKDTTHFSILDAEGNRVAATLSINYPFGSGFVPRGTGVLLNDEMDDFSAKPGTPNVYGLVGAEANAIQPNKRMLSSMSPTFLEMKDRQAIIGTPGGSRIITMVLLGALEFYEGKSAQEIVDLPRFHHQYLPDKIQLEPNALGDDVKESLAKLGHTLDQKDDTWGNMHVVIQDSKTGEVSAASDKRGIGAAQVY